MTPEKPHFVAERNVILLPDKEEFRCLHPAKLPLVHINGYAMRAVKNGPGINHLLYNKGFVFPSPILHDVSYDWAGARDIIFQSQRETAALLASRSRVYVLNDLGTGKTFATLLAIDWLMLKGYIRKALVVAPLSTLESVWGQEIRLRMPRLRSVILHGTKRQRLELLRSDAWNVAIINHDGVKVILDELLKIKFECVVLDEAAVYRDHRTDRWKKTRALVEHAPMLWGLTGSPTPNGPEDAYGQVRLITPSRMPISFKRWRSTVCIELNGLWFPKDDAKQKVHAAMQPAVRFTRAQVVELPKHHVIERSTTLSADQTRFFRIMRDKCIIMAQEGKVTAVNAAVLMGKLLQISAGAVYTEHKATIDLKADDRMNTAKELIDGSEGKVILFAPFRHIVELIMRKFKPVYGDRIAEVHGGIPLSQRTPIFTTFQERRSNLRIVVAHPGCMAHGITLTEANTIIWYAPYTSTEKTSQANARITRPGQEREQYYYHLYATNVEKRVYRVVERNGNLQAEILKMFEQKLI